MADVELAEALGSSDAWGFSGVDEEAVGSCFSGESLSTSIGEGLSMHAIS